MTWRSMAGLRTAERSAAQEEAFEACTNGKHTAMWVQQQHICTKLEESMQAMVLHSRLQWSWQLRRLEVEMWNVLTYCAAAGKHA